METFDFIAYMSPPPANARGDGKKEGEKNADFQTEEHFGNVKACGFNGLSAIYEYEEEEFEKALSLCDGMGLSFLVRDPKDIEPYMKGQREKGLPMRAFWERHGADILSRLRRYANHPSFAGMLTADEPHAGKFGGLAFLIGELKRAFPDKEFEVNLLPDYATAEQLTGDPAAAWDYGAYLDRFLGEVGTDYLSYDHYALLETAEGKPFLRASYLKNLEQVAIRAKRCGIPFKVFLQTLGFFDCRRITRYADIAWQVYTAMAYGAAGAQTFTYWTMLGYPEGNPQNVSTAVVGAQGELLPAWYAMRQVISEVRCFEKAYFGYRWERCALVGKSPLFAGMDGETRGYTAESSLPLAVGEFSADGEGRALLIANCSDPAEDAGGQVLLTFPEEGEITLHQARSSKTVRAGKLTLSLRPGEGVFAEYRAK